MNQQTRILAGLFGLVIAYGVAANVIYPRWIEPLVKIKDRIAIRQADLEKLQKLESDVEAARRTYLGFLERSGSTDVGRVETAAREQLNRLINKHGLEQASVSPNRGTVDRRTGLTQLTLTVSAEGTSQAAAQFLKDVSEMPQLMRVASATIYPASGARKADAKALATERVALRAPIEVLVLPQDRMLKKRVSDDELTPPERVVRHENRDYALIWDRTPFSEYVPLDPLVVSSGAPVTIEVGKPAAIQASAQGGDGNYTYLWSPAEGLGEPNAARTKVDTSAEGSFQYVVTVTDGRNNRASATARVTVIAPPPPPPPVAPVQTAQVPPPTPPPPPKPVRARSPNAPELRLGMILTRIEDGQPKGGVMVFDPRTRQTQFHAVGAPFEGGTLVYVHPRAALVEWDNHYFAYPVGDALNQDVDLDQSENFPYLKQLVEGHRQAKLDAARQAAEVEGIVPPPSQPSNGGTAGVPPEPAPTGAGEPSANQPEGANPGAEGPVGSQPVPDQGSATASPSVVPPSSEVANPPQGSTRPPPKRRVAPRRGGTTVAPPTPAPPGASESTLAGPDAAAPSAPPSEGSVPGVPVPGVQTGQQGSPEPAGPVSPEKPGGPAGVEGGAPATVPESQPTGGAGESPAVAPATPEDVGGDAKAGDAGQEVPPEKTLNSKEDDERRRKILEDRRKQREERRQRTTK